MQGCAYHEAGHAVRALLLGAEVISVTVQPERVALVASERPRRHQPLSSADLDRVARWDNERPTADEGSLPNGTLLDGEIVVGWPDDGRSSRQLNRVGCEVALAGPAAEAVYTGELLHPVLVGAWESDFRQAWCCAKAEWPAPRTRMRKIESTYTKLLDFFRTDHIWAAVAALADELDAHEHLEQQEIEEVLSYWL